MGRERREEDAARRVVEAIEPVQLIPRDVAGAPGGTHDFDVMRGSEVVGALEVTMLMDEDRQRLIAWIGKHGVRSRSGLEHNWYVALTDEAIGVPKSKETLQAFVDALRDLEARGMSRFEKRRWIPRDAVMMPIERLPVRLANSSSGEGETYISIMPPSEGGVAWTGNTHEAVQSALSSDRLRGERAKLERAGGREKHVFIWMDGLFEASLGMSLTDEPADEAPSLPSEITTVWVAASAEGGAVVWRSSGGSWERHVVPRTAIRDD